MPVDQAISISGLGNCVWAVGQELDHATERAIRGERAYPPANSNVKIVALAASSAYWAAHEHRHARDLPHFEQAQRKAQGACLHPRNAESTTVAVPGLGQPGASAARQVQRQSFRTLGWSRSLAEMDGVGCHAGDEALDGAHQQAGIVVPMLPDTLHTRGLTSAGKHLKINHGARLANAAALKQRPRASKGMTLQCASSKASTASEAHSE